MTDAEVIANIARIVAKRDPSTDPTPSNPQLAVEIARLREECGMQMRVLKAQPDALIVLVENGVDGPFLMSICADHLPKKIH